MTPDLLNEVSKVNGSLELIALLLKVIGIGVGLITALVIYTFKREIGHANSKAQVGIDKAEKLEDEAKEEAKRIDKDFMSVQACNTRHI